MNASRTLDMAWSSFAKTPPKIYMSKKKERSRPQMERLLKPSNEFLKGFLSALPLWLQASLIAVTSCKQSGTPSIHQEPLDHVERSRYVHDGFDWTNIGVKIQAFAKGNDR
ncbi:hypothetical protein E4U17_000314 [Claviceps sp. LM77 group G4]|nr:hypothetical protein E4U17_000314 [Claviceps sp. LM77 group G4]KAG6053048.1 hypothetical protein E4U33_000320 [Claviceps sp. LM78 group G4]KAG6066231.1 hypothetical protein E4U16_000291 [Claviceps sp. LM84 group G4]